MIVHIRPVVGQTFLCGRETGQWTYIRKDFNFKKPDEMCKECIESEEYGMWLLKHMDKDSTCGTPTIDWLVEQGLWQGTMTGRIPK